jgi:hypothetical protein
MANTKTPPVLGTVPGLSDGNDDAVKKLLESYQSPTVSQAATEYDPMDGILAPQAAQAPISLLRPDITPTDLGAQATPGAFSPGGLLGKVGLSDPSTGLPTTGDVGRPAPSMATNPLGSVQDIGRPTVKSAQEMQYETDADRLAKRQADYSTPAHGVLGHLAHFFRNSEGAAEAPLRANVAQDLQGLATQEQINNVADKELDENAEKGTPQYQAMQTADLKLKQGQASEAGQPKDEFQLWHQQNPNGTPLQYHQAMVAPQSPDSAAARTKIWGPSLQKLGLPADLFSSPNMTEADAVDAEKTLKTQLGDANQSARLDAMIAHQNAAGANIGTWSLQNQAQPDGTQKTVLLNSKTGEIKPAPEGLVKPGPKATADELKRADLSANLISTANDVEDILTRRPELFGIWNGRMTQLKGAMGSDDPDIRKLYQARHQLGIVVNSAHSLRSAQGVESAANALLNGFVDSPDAVKGALEEAKKSGQQFIYQANHPGEDRNKSIETTGNATSSGTYKTTATDSKTGHKVGTNDNWATTYDLQTGKKL